MRVVTPPRKICKYKDANYQSMWRDHPKQISRKRQQQKTFTTLSPFKDKIHSLMDSYIPSKILRGIREHKPWVSWQVQTLLHKSKTLYQRQRRTGKVRDIRHHEETKAQLQKAERQSYWHFVDNIIEVGDPGQDQQPKQKIFWSYIH